MYVCEKGCHILQVIKFLVSRWQNIKFFWERCTFTLQGLCPLHPHRKPRTLGEDFFSRAWPCLCLSHQCCVLIIVAFLPCFSWSVYRYQWAFVGAQRRRRRIVAEDALAIVGPPEFEPYMVRMVDLLDQVSLCPTLGYSIRFVNSMTYHMQLPSAIGHLKLCNILTVLNRALWKGLSDAFSL